MSTTSRTAAYINVHSSEYPAVKSRGSTRWRAGRSRSKSGRPTAASQRPMTKQTPRAAHPGDLRPDEGSHGRMMPGPNTWVDASSRKRRRSSSRSGCAHRRRHRGVDHMLTRRVRASRTAPDQLRQRVAFAPHQIFVISTNHGAWRAAARVANYYDVLLKTPWKLRTLLEDVTLTPRMGLYPTCAEIARPPPPPSQ